ncbi:hypothetical protein YC2023_071169 [Brassica napus]
MRFGESEPLDLCGTSSPQVSYPLRRCVNAEETRFGIVVSDDVSMSLKPYLLLGLGPASILKLPPYQENVAKVLRGLTRLLVVPDNNGSIGFQIKSNPNPTPAIPTKQIHSVIDEDLDPTRAEPVLSNMVHFGFSDYCLALVIGVDSHD